MSKPNDVLYQFRIELEGILPKIWRSIQVPSSYTFFEFHNAIQCSMGWYNCHLHRFDVDVPMTGERITIGSHDVIQMDGNGVHESKAVIKDYFTKSNNVAVYEYDFGDSWCHKITFEKEVTPTKSTKYPICIDGKNACPPEDCGGVWGYKHLIKILKDTSHSDYDDLLEVAGEDFDPGKFSKKDVIFE